ncbi:DUF4129 domain-containing protein [Intrasporangium flavum]|uniref:DUF4129 domain-containing protein n=1 Tax=Intrasporangium flavum TaxID=1428657 RepID=UPI0009FB3697|nr:DUF4129 domain-containing protein [Intrasporangium flavum]
MTLAALLPTSPPLDPSVEEARAWLAGELASPAYADDRSWLDRFTDWLDQQLSGVGGHASAPGWALPVVLVVLALVVVTILLVAVRRSPTASRTGAAGGVLDEPHLTAADYRIRAEAALDRGDAATATADAFRAVAASAAERTLLDDVPGRTAHEIGAALAAVFPGEARAVRGSADLFDRVVYGRVPVDAADARDVLDLDARLRATRPVLAASAVATVGGGVR